MTRPRLAGFDPSPEAGEGTSYATPHVAATVALVRTMHPEWDYRDVRKAVLGSAEYLPQLFGLVRTSARLNTWYALRVDPGVDSDGDGILDHGHGTCGPQPAGACSRDDLPGYLASCADSCPLQANPCQEDLDEDAVGDACDDDIDGDGISNVVQIDGSGIPYMPDSSPFDPDL